MNGTLHSISQFIRSLNFGDFFSGIGGFRLALEGAGAKCAFSCEIDEDARTVYRANFHDTPAGDITKIDAKDIPDLDVLAAGFPCQDTSICGKQMGLAGSRSGLFFEIVRIAAAKRPAMLLIENVDRLVHLKGGRDLETACRSLGEAGYDVHWMVLNAAQYGCPTARKRIYFACFRSDLGVKGFHFPAPNAAPSRLKDVLLPPAQVRDLVVEDSGVHYNLDPDIFAGISPTCAPILVGYVGAGSQGGRVYHSAGPAATFCTFGGGVGGPTGVYYVGGVTRKLHHRECARAMGFPDSFSFPVSDGIAKQLIGNSVAVLVVRKIFEAMVRAYVGREGGAPTHRSSVELSAVPVVAGVAWAKVKLAGADPGCPLNVVSLFSGCGGLDTGFEQAGFNVVLGTDKWGKAMATYRANHPNSKAVCVDIATEAGKAEICALAEEAGGVDVVIGGPPCKTFSGLNKKRRKDLESDPMSFLFRHYFEVIRRLKPKCFVMENVLPREKRRLRGQRVLDAWLQAAGDCGYRTECRILCASDYGTPQSRKRVIIIGILATSGAPILFPKPSHDEHGRNGLPKWITAKEAIGDLENAPEDINSAHVQFEQSANLLRKISAIKCGGFLGKRGLGYRRLYPDRPAGTIVASSTSRPIHYSLDRLLTPREAARLQGFRDTYHFDATDPRSAYAVIGNAVPVQMARAVAVSVRTMFLKMHEQNQPERSVVPGQAGRALRQAQVSAVPEAAERAA